MLQINKRGLLVLPRVLSGSLTSLSEGLSFSMAGKRRPRWSSACSTATSKHMVGYNASWKEDFPWHIPVYDAAGSTVTGLLCSLCKQHQTKQRNSAGTWTKKPCGLLRRDIIQRHKDSKMHKEAEELEATRLASQRL